MMQFAEAHQLLCGAVAAAPASAKYRNSLGVALQEAGRWREAADAFERANEKDPLNVQVGLRGWLAGWLRGPRGPCCLEARNGTALHRA